MTVYALFPLAVLAVALIVWASYWFECARLRKTPPASVEWIKARRNLKDEAVLLGPVSAWVAEGEARAVREWGRPHERIEGHKNLWKVPALCPDCRFADITTPAQRGHGNGWELRKPCALHRRNPDAPNPTRGPEWP